MLCGDDLERPLSLSHRWLGALIDLQQRFRRLLVLLTPDSLIMFNTILMNELNTSSHYTLLYTI